MAAVRAAILLALALASTAQAEDGPFETPAAPVTAEAARPEPGRIPPRAPLPIRAYRAAARFQGPRCPHRPSCSAYAAEAIHAHGPILGSFAGAARLLRGSRSSAAAPLPRTEDGALWDPLQASTFFLGDGR